MRQLGILGILIAPIIAITILVSACGESHHEQVASTRHTNITATVFWVGEAAAADNAYIPNDASAWDGHWQVHFGGVDTPSARQHGGDWPAGFTPKENPFYVALPYGEFDENGNVRPDASRIPWYSAVSPPHQGFSILKNHWLKITTGDKTAYAQWEDVGPMSTDDAAYVFGTSRPAYQPSGIDLSPATANRLGVDGKATVSWQFVTDSDVPDGPWKQIVTTRQMSS